MICKECGKEFDISLGEQQYFKARGLELPKRCLSCRKARKAAREQEAKQKKWEEDEKNLDLLLSTVSFAQTSLGALVFDNPDHTLVVIGNGFDIVHGVKSSYWDFQKTIGKKSSLRFGMETYLDVPADSLWCNLEDSLGRMNYSMFLNSLVLDMWLDNFEAYHPDAQAADFFAAVETAIEPTFTIPRELNLRFKKWVRTLKVESAERPFSILHGNYKVLSFNYTEFIEDLYGAKAENICYIHGCRKHRGKGKPDELILGHVPGREEEQWNKVKWEPIKFQDPYKKYIFEAAIETAVTEAAWYDDSTTKNCSEIIKKHSDFFDGLTDVKEVFVIGHSLSEVDYPYFSEIAKRCTAKWTIGYHSLDDMKRLIELVHHLGLADVTVFRT